MKKYLSVFVIAGLALALSACGGVKSIVVKQPSGIEGIRTVKIAPVEVKSKEDNEDAAKLNAQWKKLAEDELQALFTGRKISAAPNAQTTVACRIDVVYGNRALRYFVGFGAGAGNLTVTLELKNRNGNVQYATESKADLAGGGFGGDMVEVAKKTIQAAVKEFGSRL